MIHFTIKQMKKKAHHRVKLFQYYFQQENCIEHISTHYSSDFFPIYFSQQKEGILFLFFSSFARWKNLNLEKWKHLPKVTQPAHHGAGIWTQMEDSGAKHPNC